MDHKLNPKNGIIFSSCETLSMPVIDFTFDLKELENGLIKRVSGIEYIGNKYNSDTNALF